MANDFYTANQVAEVGLKLAEEDAFLSALVSREIVNPLAGGGKGRTVDVKVPTALIAHERGIDDKTTALLKDELSETTVPVTLGTRAYSNVWLSDGDLSLDLRDFSAQVLAPQIDAVTDFVENEVADALNAITLDTSIAWDPADPVPTFTAIRKLLRKRGVPQTGLQVVVGVDVYAALLDAKAITDNSESGSTAALREGNVGRIRGFNIVESTRVADDQIVAFHRSAFTLVVRPPVVSPGASFGTTLTSRGFGLRYIRDYDSQHTADYSLVDTMLGVAAMPLYRVTRNYGASTASVSSVTGGGAFRMSISDTEPA